MATLFKEVNYNLLTLIQQIDLGIIGLPDIQRTFVWKDTKVRDLFDSMYKGYPVGYFLFWANGYQENTKTIGDQNKQKAAQLLIVDGQQRLTSLFAVMKSKQVIRENYKTECIVVSFKPLEEKFEIPDAATKRSPEYIQSISELWSPDINIFSFTQNFIEKLQQTRNLTSEEINKIQESISRLKNLEHYPFSVLELSASIDEEQVADVFVRINSQGKKLNTTDFILTLMSVFWEQGRKDLENFCSSARQPNTSEASAFNYLITPDPDQMLRVSVGFGFRRARMQYVYSILRGKDLETGEFSEERRDDQFSILQKSQEKVLGITNWHEFLKAIQRAGYLRSDYISSQVNVLYAYTFYLIGKYDFQVPLFELREIIARWFYMASLTARYSASAESQMEADLANLRDISTAEEFVSLLDASISTHFTNDFWQINLPSDLATSSSRSPSLFSYYAALNVLDAKGLFSQLKVSDLLHAGFKSNKSSLEKHHLFPKNYLVSLGIGDQRVRNQIANFALVEWSDNIKISDSSPQEYMEIMKERFDHDQLREMFYWHALPDDWQNMPYEEFLVVRRQKIADIIQAGYHKLSNIDLENDDEITSVKQLIQGGESENIEFKSTMRVNLFTNNKDQKIEMAFLKTIAAFLNSNGGVLVVGVNDAGESLGLEADGFENEDKLYSHAVNLIRDRMGSENALYIHPQFEDYQGKQIFVVKCRPALKPVYVKDQNQEKFFARTGNSTTDLNGRELEDYINLRFRR
jgi:hypothetical protein